MTHRPCGACRTLVPADTGCEHWRPGRSVKAADSAARRLSGREQRRRDREDAAARVAEFARIMGRTYQ